MKNKIVALLYLEEYPKNCFECPLVYDHMECIITKEKALSNKRGLDCPLSMITDDLWQKLLILSVVDDIIEKEGVVEL